MLKYFFRLALPLALLASAAAAQNSSGATVQDIDFSFVEWRVRSLVRSCSCGRDAESPIADARREGAELVLAMRPHEPCEICPDTFATLISLRLSGATLAGGARAKRIAGRFTADGSEQEIRLPLIPDSRLADMAPHLDPAALSRTAKRLPRPSSQWYVHSGGGLRASAYLTGFDMPVFSMPFLLWYPAELELFPLRDRRWTASALNSTMVGLATAEVYVPRGTRAKAVIVPSRNHETVSGDTVRLGLPFSILPLSLNQYLFVQPAWTVKATARAHPLQFLTYRPERRAATVWWDPVLDLGLSADVWFGGRGKEHVSAGGLVSREFTGTLGLRATAGMFVTGAPPRWAVEMESGERWRVPQPRGVYTRLDLLFGTMTLNKGTPAPRIRRWSRAVAREATRQ